MFFIGQLAQFQNFWIKIKNIYLKRIYITYSRINASYTIFIDSHHQIKKSITLSVIKIDYKT